MLTSMREAWREVCRYLHLQAPHSISPPPRPVKRPLCAGQRRYGMDTPTQPPSPALRNHLVTGSPKRKGNSDQLKSRTMKRAEETKAREAYGLYLASNPCPVNCYIAGDQWENRPHFERRTYCVLGMLQALAESGCAPTPEKIDIPWPSIALYNCPSYFHLLQIDCRRSHSTLGLRFVHGELWIPVLRPIEPRVLSRGANCHVGDASDPHPRVQFRSLSRHLKPRSWMRESLRPWIARRAPQN